jgi:hypothetical protein
LKTRPEVTVCVLAYGDYPELIRRAVGSIRDRFPPGRYELAVGANSPGAATLEYLSGLQREGALARLTVSTTNLNKCGMMRRMFERVRTPWIWWFDDDSYVTDSSTFDRWLSIARRASARTMMWGQLAECDDPAEFTDLPDAVDFVRRAEWYRGLPPPDWRPGGKGEFDHEGKGRGDGRWIFILGGCWLIRARAVRALGWPDGRLVKLGDDVFLGEALRQQGWQMENVGSAGICLNPEPRRGEAGRATVG